MGSTTSSKEFPTWLAINTVVAVQDQLLLIVILALHSLMNISLKMEACPACHAALNLEWLSLRPEGVSNSVEMGSDPLQ